MYKFYIFALKKLTSFTNSGLQVVPNSPLFTPDKLCTLCQNVLSYKKRPVWRCKNILQFQFGMNFTISLPGLLPFFHKSFMKINAGIFYDLLFYGMRVNR